MRRGLRILATVGALSWLAAAAGAQTITITGPAATTVKEGDDFFTTVMNEAEDFNQRRDFMWEENFSEPTISATGGVWSGTFASQGGYVFPLFPVGGTLAFMPIGRTGDRFPVDTTKYKYLSVKRRVTSRSTQAVYVGTSTNFPTDQLCAGFDGYFIPAKAVPFPSNAWTLDAYDLRQASVPRCDQYNPAKWTGQIRGIRLDPSTGGAAGTTVGYDFVRLVDPTSAPQVTITWTTSGAPAASAVNIYVDDNNSGNDGAFIGRVATAAGSFTFPSAALPPGNWFFYVELHENQSTDAVLARSAYSAALTVNGRTRVTVTNPSMTSGPDYATEMLNNPWDFNDSTDIANFNMTDPYKQFKSPSFSSGIFSATAFAPVPPATESDVQVWMNTTSTTGANRPIPTWRYRYFNYTYSIDPTLYGNIADKVRNGWIARAIWWTNGINVDGSESAGAITYEGTNTYAVDLSDNANVLSKNNPFPSQKGWNGLPSVQYFRIDPGEFTQFETNFFFDDVKLRARPEPNGSNQFTVRLATSDPEGDNATIQFFKDADNTGCNGTLLGTIASSPPGQKSFPFSTASLFPQDFWIYAVATDAAGNATCQYGDAPVHVGPQVWQPFFAVDPLETPFVGDFNGDGKTDIITFTRQNPLAFGDVYVALSNGSQFVDKNGNPGSSDKWHDFFAINTSEQVVIGDYDGDGKDDIATWLSTTTHQVYVALSTGTGMTQPSVVWVNSIGSDPTDLLFAGDVNGDGKKDLILFARKQGKVYVALSNGTSFGAPTVWHNFFAVSTYERPRVGDVNGDGRADIITFATDSPTAFGDVYVALSNGTQFVDANGLPNSSTKWHDFFAIDPTQQIAIGDINHDGKSDFFTFLPWPFGQSYVVQSQGTSMGPNVLWINEGGVYSTSTDVAYVGDVNGDGKADIIIFRKVPGKVEVVLTP